MVIQARHIINESEKSRILISHGNSPMDNYAVVEWLSPDEKYAIFLDELYDIENKVKIGNVFENFDNFRFFLKHSFEVAQHITEDIKIELMESVNSLLITESNQDMRGLKPYVKELLKEYTFNPFSSEFYSGKNWKEIGQKTVDVGKRTVQGVKDIASNISKGDWSAAMGIIGKGALWVARKIRSALYNPVGMVLDAILMATGIGKGLQFVVWAIVVALDIYELMSGNFEEKDFSIGWRLLFLGIDILGMVTAGAAAVAAKSFVGRLLIKFGKSAEGLSNAVKSTPALKSTLSKILSASSSASSVMVKAQTSLQKSSPMIYKFLSGIMSGLGKFLNMMVDTLKGILNIGGKVLNAPGKLVTKLAPNSVKGTKFVAGLSSSANVLAPLGAAHAYQDYKTKETEEEMYTNLKSSTVTPVYDQTKF